MFYKNFCHMLIMVCKLTVSDLVKEQTETADTITYLKLFVILYADDTVILAESIPELQAALNGMNHYCVMWKLKINTMKTKVVIFSRQKVKEKPKFMLGENELEIVDEYKYLGFSFKYNGNLSTGICEIKNQASRAMYSLINKAKKLNLAIDIQLNSHVYAVKTNAGSWICAGLFTTRVCL